VSKPESPLAFPSVETHPSYDMPMHHFGMSLRDWFAGQCLAGHMARSNMTQPTDPKIAAEAFYSIADAMLVERAKGDE
jgi:hypothetical protein